MPVYAASIVLEWWLKGKRLDIRLAAERSDLWYCCILILYKFLTSLCPCHQTVKLILVNGWWSSAAREVNVGLALH